MRLRMLYASAFILSLSTALIALHSGHDILAFILTYAAASVLALGWRGCASRLIADAHR